MEQRFKSLPLFEFQECFPDVESCLLYLSDLKWKDGFHCGKCGHSNYCNSVLGSYHRQCTSCHYMESPTAGTLFHGVKFDLVKAFYIVYFVSTNKKRITSTELSQKLNLRQKTCWAFKRKVMKAMKSSGYHPITDRAEMDETVFGKGEEGVRGRQNKRKRLCSLP